MRKQKSVWLFLDGKKHCDCVLWALAANKTLQEAKEHLQKHYGDMFKVEFRII